jgi:hypothetical protein
VEVGGIGSIDVNRDWNELSNTGVKNMSAESMVQGKVVVVTGAVVKVHLYGSFHVSRAAAAHFKEQASAWTA